MAAVASKWRQRPQNGGNGKKNGGGALKVAATPTEWREMAAKCWPRPQNGGNGKKKNGGGALKMAAGPTNGSGAQEIVEKLG